MIDEKIKCKIMKTDIFYYGYIETENNKWISVVGPCYTRLGVKYELKKWKKRRKKNFEEIFYI